MPSGFYPRRKGWQVKQWLANLLWDALKIFLGRGHDWVFDPQRAALARFRDRERWWAYRQKALATQDPRDDLRAQWFQARFGFETPPSAAINRGDLDPHARQLALDAVEKARATRQHP
jgi:hypothetical protein